MLDYLHILLGGPSGSGKSRLAASTDTPQLIALFDSLGNAAPYFRNCRVKRTRDVVMIGGRPSIIPTFDCYALEDIELTTLQRRVWHFNPANEHGKAQFDIKRPLLAQECESIKAPTFIFDSLTMFHSGMRVQGKKYVGDSSQDEEQLNYRITDQVEDLCIWLCALEVTVILCAHVSLVEYNKRIGKNTIKVADTRINAPGKMGRNITGMFSDVWYTFIDEEGEYKVLTQGSFDSGEKTNNNAKNTVNAPAICNNIYSEIVNGREPIIWVE